MSRASEALISVVIPCYRTDKLIPRCLESVINQTYKNLEIICVNDGSGDETTQLLQNFRKKDNRIRIVVSKKNRGLFLARLLGAKKATGDYVAFVDSDDYVECDYFRQLLSSATEQKSDLVIANFCRDHEGEKFVFPSMSANMMVDETINESYFEQFIKSEGRYYRWHVIWDKLISKKLWDKASPYFEKVDCHLVMCEDVVFSTILLALAKKICFNDEVFYFYYESDDSITAIDRENMGRTLKNIKDIIFVFNLIEDALQSIIKHYDCVPHLIRWRNAYLNIWIRNSAKSDMAIVRKQVKSLCPDYQRADLDIFSAALQFLAPFDERLLEIKKQIILADTVSFDVFDTLVLRPFLRPSDLFILMDDYAAELLTSNHIVLFSDLRRIAEEKCRETTTNQEVTINDIYEQLVQMFGVDKESARKLKSLEIKLEKRFCYVRKYGKYLYNLAQFLGKRIIITSDMYLPCKTVKEILIKNGFKNYDKLYLSNELNMTKHSGDLYSYIIDHEPKGTILHIDDSEHNCAVALERGLDSFFVPRAINEFDTHGGTPQYYFCDRNHNHDNYTKITGVQISLAMVGNKFFDNPFLPFNPESDFNNSPYYLGYYALGMHMLALAYWLLSDAKNRCLDTLVFMARDGFLPMKCVEIMQTKMSEMNKLRLEYFYTSRKSTMPLALGNKFDFGASITYMAWDYTNPLAAIEQWKPVLDLPENYEKILIKSGFNLNKTFRNTTDFYKFMGFVRDNFYSHDKFLRYRKMAEDYSRMVCNGKTGIFDIGYSAKPELLMSELIDDLAVTYFIHVNSSEGIRNARLAESDLMTFYDFAPTFTGVLREAFLSAIAPSCKSYRRVGNKVEPVFSSSIKYDAYTKDVLATVQRGAMQFIRDFCDLFGDNLDRFDFNRYYMSIPFEHYMHYSRRTDREMFGKMYFEDNVNKYIKVIDFWEKTEEDYITGFSLYERMDPLVQQQPIIKTIKSFPARRSSRLLYYLLFDRKMLRGKFNTKTLEMEFSPSLLRRISYHLLHNKKAIPAKAKKKLSKNRSSS